MYRRFPNLSDVLFPRFSCDSTPGGFENWTLVEIVERKMIRGMDPKGCSVAGHPGSPGAQQLIKWAADQKSLVAFVAISVVPVIFVLTSVFALWAGYQWGMIAAGAIVFGGAIAIRHTRMVTAGNW